MSLASCSSQLEGLRKILRFPTRSSFSCFPQTLWDSTCAFAFNLEDDGSQARVQSNYKIFSAMNITLAIIVHTFINKILIMLQSREIFYFSLAKEWKKEIKKKKSKKIGTFIYKLSLASLLWNKTQVLWQNSLYDLIYLLLVNIKSWYATVNTSLLFPQVKACGLIFYRCIIKPQHTCCYFNIFINCPMPHSFECCKFLPWYF